MKTLKEYFLGLKQYFTKKKARYSPLDNVANITPTKQIPKRTGTVPDVEDSCTKQRNIYDYLQVDMDLRYSSNLNI